MRGLFASMLGLPQAAAPPSMTWAPDDDRWYAEGAGLRSMSASGRHVTPELAMNLSAVYACVNLRATTVAALPLRMYRKDRKGQSFEAPEHPLNDLLEFQPNRWQTAWDFRAMLEMHLLLRGNAYAEIIAGPRGFADRLEPLHPDRVTVERLTDGSIRYRVSEMKGPDRFLLQDEILHIRSAISPNGLIGMSPVSYARETVGLGLATEEHGARLFSNGARPSGVLQVPEGLSEPAFERLKTEWRGMYSGLANVHKTPILEEGTEFKSISLTSEDAQFLATREFQIEEIARWFNVPLVMLHHMTKASSWGTGIEAIMLAFVRNNLNPSLAAWTQAIRRDLILVPALYEAKFDVEELIKGDSKAQAEFYSKLVLNGIITRNEARWALGYNPLDELDKPLVPTNTTTPENMPRNDDPPPASDAALVQADEESEE